MQATVLGAGSFGTCLALLLHRCGHGVTLWVRGDERLAKIRAAGENADYLPGYPIPGDLRLTTDPAEALGGAELVVVVMPSQTVRENMTRMARLLPPEAPVVCAAKGIEEGSLMTMDQVLAEVLPASLQDKVAVLSGPSFAKEVAAGVPTAVSIGCRDAALAGRLQQAFSDATFRAYATTDVTGLEIGGALKNVVAIAAGICDGMKLGHNSLAALITRGLAEITRLAVHMGGDPRTLAGLGGIGDLVLTCTGGLSRNRSVGVQLGEGKTLKEILAGMHMVAEGVKTAHSAWDLAQREGVDMPITEQVYRILYEDKKPQLAVRELMTRELKHEQA